jgi:D-alanyl-D-alanine carboxypeptidase (penicillin-binding protein 5/6)
MPLTRRQIYRRRRITIFGGLAVVLAALIYAVGAGTAPLPASAAEVVAPTSLTAAAAAPSWPDFGESAIGAVGFDGVLASSGDQGAVPIASITKMVTSLVILDAKPLAAGEQGPNITFTAADVDIYYDTIAEDGSSAPVVAGMVLTERQALEAMLLPSANNYAVSLATWAYGSVDKYLAAASAWIAAHNLTATTIVDTSGLSAGSMSSPADLVEIAKLVQANPVLAEIVSMTKADLPTIGVVNNTNKLLGDFGVNGIKTGTTDEAGACLLFSADITVGSHTVTLVGVVLGGATHPELNESIATLIESVVPGFHDVELTKKGAEFATYTTKWGQTAHAVTAEAASAVVWSDTPISAQATTTTLRTGSEGESVGAVDFAVGSKTISVPLVLDAKLKDPGFGWRLTNPGTLG